MPDDEMKYMEEHPPRCLRGHSMVASDELRNFIQKDYGRHTTVFSLRCSCGQSDFESSVPDGFGPVTVVCKNCNSDWVLFDPAIHGYDGELGHNSGMETAGSKRCSCECGCGVFSLTCGFQYSGETEILEEEEIDIAPEDLYGWFVLVGKCASCKQAKLLLDWECA